VKIIGIVLFCAVLWTQSPLVRAIFTSELEPGGSDLVSYVFRVF